MNSAKTSISEPTYGADPIKHSSEKFDSTLEFDQSLSLKTGHLTAVIGQCQHRVKLYAGTLFIALDHGRFLRFFH